METMVHFQYYNNTKGRGVLLGKLVIQLLQHYWIWKCYV